MGGLQHTTRSFLFCLSLVSSVAFLVIMKRDRHWLRGEELICCREIMPHGRQAKTVNSSAYQKTRYERMSPLLYERGKQDRHGMVEGLLPLASVCRVHI